MLPPIKYLGIIAVAILIILIVINGFQYFFGIDVIAKVSQLNHRTVEQVLKGMQQVGLLQPMTEVNTSGDWLKVVDPEGMKAVYSATRDKVPWWPLRS